MIRTTKRRGALHRRASAETSRDQPPARTTKRRGATSPCGGGIPGRRFTTRGTTERHSDRSLGTRRRPPAVPGGDQRIGRHEAGGRQGKRRTIHLPRKAMTARKAIAKSLYVT